MSLCQMMSVVLVCLALSVNAEPTQAKAKQPKANDVEELKAEVARLRADLDAALREIAALKAAANGGKAAPDDGPVYRGRSAKSWLEQLKDLEPKTRVDALEALGVLGQKDKKLIPVLADLARNDTGRVFATGKGGAPAAGRPVSTAAVRALGAAGPEALPALIDLVKDNKERYQAITEIGNMGPKAKSAVPVLVRVLDEQPQRNPLNNTVAALNNIGPDAKEAIPALVKALGHCLEDIGIPEDQGKVTRFGILPYSLNVVIVKTLSDLDPDLAKDIPLPMILDRKRAVPNSGVSSLEQQQEWRALHAALVKRYVKSK